MKAPQTLKELIEAAIVRHDGASVRQLAFKAQDEGFKVVHTTLNAIRAGSYKSVPRNDTLRALAWLAGVDDAVAFTAAGQPVPGPPLADELPDGADHLSAKSRRALIEMARVLVDLEGIRDGQQHADPDPTASAGGAGEADRARFGSAQTDSVVPAIEDLAAHPNMPLAADQWDETFGAAGEENQDPGEGA